jgi:hypothetical protein
MRRSSRSCLSSRLREARRTRAPVRSRTPTEERLPPSRRPALSNPHGSSPPDTPSGAGPVGGTESRLWHKNHIRAVARQSRVTRIALACAGPRAGGAARARVLAYSPPTRGRRARAAGAMKGASCGSSDLDRCAGLTCRYILAYHSCNTSLACTPRVRAP